jgi:hypothetical protein
LAALMFERFTDLCGLKLSLNWGGVLGTAEAAPQSRRSAVFGIDRAAAFYERYTPKLRLSSVLLQRYWGKPWIWFGQYMDSYLYRILHIDLCLVSNRWK